MILDAQGVQVSLIPGSIVASGSYTLRAYYQGYLILAEPITPATPSGIQLQMVATSTSRSNYLVFNSTITSANVVENSSSRIVFSVVGTGPSLIIVKVPVKPLTVERDGTMISSWTYNSTTSTVAIETAQLGTFTLVYSNPAPSGAILYYIGALITGALVVITGVLLWQRKTRSTKSTQAKRNGKAASTKQFKPKNKKSSLRS
jgi:hypothetical protein